MVIIYGISNCDTIKKTCKWFQHEGLDFKFHDFREQGIDAALVNRFLEQFNHEELINRRGTTWRKLSDSQKQSLTRESAIDLMLDQPAIIKRPILNKNKLWQLGFDESALQKLV